MEEVVKAQGGGGRGLVTRPCGGVRHARMRGTRHKADTLLPGRTPSVTVPHRSASPALCPFGHAAASFVVVRRRSCVVSGVQVSGVDGAATSGGAGRAGAVRAIRSGAFVLISSLSKGHTQDRTVAVPPSPRRPAVELPRLEGRYAGSPKPRVRENNQRATAVRRMWPPTAVAGGVRAGRWAHCSARPFAAVLSRSLKCLRDARPVRAALPPPST